MAVDRIEFNLFITTGQYDQIARLRETGLNLSSLARLALRKLAQADLDPEDDSPRPKRAVVYLSPDDALTLQIIADRKGISRAMAIRQILTTYLRIHSVAIESLF